MRKVSLACLAMVLAATSLPAFAAEKPADSAEAKKGDDAKGDELPMLPAPKSIKQSAVIGGKTVNYVATVGALPIKDEKGKTIGEVVYTAYTVPGAPTSRP